jgi:hypothetical protein
MIRATRFFSSFGETDHEEDDDDDAVDDGESVG